MHFVFKGKKIDGSQFVSKKHLNPRGVNLSRNQLQSIDLSPLLNQGNGLKYLILSKNQLQSIDLAILQNCKRLEKLDLSGNQLQSINLTPLERCTELTELILWSNNLKHIDLAPLQNCKKLERLVLSGNQLQSINLTSLERCTELNYIELLSNQLQELDLSPLQKCKKLRTVFITQGNDTSSHDFPELTWSIPVYDISSLPTGIMEFSDKLEQLWEESKEIAEKKTFTENISKVLDYINRIRPNIPISVITIAEAVNIERKTLESVLIELVQQNPELGEYLELEKTFIKTTEAGVEIDRLLKAFNEFEKTGKGKELE